MSSPRKEDREKRLNSGRGEGSIFTTGPGLKVHKNNTLSSMPVVLLRSTNPRIKLGPTRGQESTRRPPAWANTDTFFASSMDVLPIPRLAIIGSAFIYRARLFPTLSRLLVDLELLQSVPSSPFPNCFTVLSVTG